MRLDIIHNTDREKLQARTTFLWFKWINRYLQCTVQFAIFHSELFRILYLLAGWEGVGSILHYLAPANLSWGGGPALQEENI